MTILITIWLLFGLLTAISCALEGNRFNEITIEDVLLFLVTTIGGFVSMTLVLSAIRGWGETVIWTRKK